MGLGASQVRLLQLISRDRDIDLQCTRLSNDKMSLTRDVERITHNYQMALSSKSLKWSADAGITCKDITYNILMRPNEYNIKNPVLITNSAGKVVIDEKYKKFAEMISPDGSIGGTYDGEKRLKILNELIGLSPEQETAYSATASSVQKASDAVKEALKERDKISNKSVSLDVDSFIKKFLNASTLGLGGTKVTKDNVDSVASTLDKAIIGKNYFSKKQEDAITKAIHDETKGLIKDVKNSSSEQSIEDFIGAYAGAIKQALGGGDKINVMADSNGNGLQAEYDEADAKYQAALEEYNKALDANAQVYTNDEQIKIDYYDALFTSIVDNGWVYDGSVDDSEYLSQMFQNNQYYITTIEKNDCFDPDMEDCLRNYDYMYSTDLASNFKNIFMVNDSDAREEALVEYEYQKQKLNAKEAAIDTKMENLKTEKQSIAKMIESIKKVEEDNIENTMKLWA